MYVCEKLFVKSGEVNYCKFITSKNFNFGKLNNNNWQPSNRFPNLLAQLISVITKQSAFTLTANWEDNKLELELESTTPDISISSQQNKLNCSD
jgi:hypothetical protein